MIPATLWSRYAPARLIVLLVGLLYLPILFLSWRFALPRATMFPFPVLLGDSTEYVTLAKNTVEHHTFSLDATAPFTPDTTRTPGYPVMIAAIQAVSKNWYFISFVQILLVATTALLLFNIGQRLVSSAAGLAAALLFVVNPSTVFYSITVMSDILFIFLLVLATYLLFFSPPRPSRGGRIRRSFLALRSFSEGGSEGGYAALAAGAGLGAATLVRPIAMFLPLVFAAFFVLRERRAITPKKLMIVVVALFIGYGAVILPWIVRNRQGSGSWSLSSIGSFNFFHYNVPQWLSYRDGVSAETVRAEFYAKTPGLTESDAKQLRHSREIMPIAVEKIRQDPFGYLRFHFSRTPQFFLGSNLKNVYVNALEIFKGQMTPFPEKTLLTDDILKRDFGRVWQRLQSQAVFVLEYLFWAVIFLLALASLTAKKQRLYGLFFLTFALYFATLTGPTIHVRYRLPAEPWLFLAAGIGAHGISERRKEQERKSGRMFDLKQEYPYFEEVNLGITRLLPSLEPGKAKPRILDCGCGRGALGAELSRRGYEVWGMELNPDACATAQTRLHRLIRADVTDIAGAAAALGNEKFDYIIFSDVLEHLYDPLFILKNYRQFLAPGGRILISLPNLATWETRLKLLFGSFNYADTGVMDRTHIRFFTFNTAKRLVTEAGLQVEKVGCDPYIIRALLPLVKALWPTSSVSTAEANQSAAANIMDSSIYTWYLRFVYPIEYGLTRLWKRLLSFRIIIVAKENEP